MLFYGRRRETNERQNGCNNQTGRAVGAAGNMTTDKERQQMVNISDSASRELSAVLGSEQYQGKGLFVNFMGFG